MTRFRFSLERVLALRASAERLQAIIMQRAATAEGERRTASEASAAGLARIQDQKSGTGAVPAGVRQAYELSAEAARLHLAQETAALLAAETHRLDEEARFTEARMARRALERLRERQEGEWSVRESRADQALSDELARQRYREERSA